MAWAKDDAVALAPVVKFHDALVAAGQPPGDARLREGRPRVRDEEAGHRQRPLDRRLRALAARERRHPILSKGVRVWRSDPDDRRRSASPHLRIPPSPQMIHVVLVHPEIHWNTGNAGRTCLATGATLHLIEPLGFSLDEREVKRAGLDYWEHVDLRMWPSWEAFERELPSARRAVVLLDEGEAGVTGTRRSARRRTSCSCSGGRRAGCRTSCTSATPIAWSRCRSRRRSCGRSICPRAWGSRCTRCCGNGGRARV